MEIEFEEQDAKPWMIGNSGKLSKPLQNEAKASEGEKGSRTQGTRPRSERSRVADDLSRLCEDTIP